MTALSCLHLLAARSKQSHPHGAPPNPPRLAIILCVREEPAPKRMRRQASEWWVVGPKEQQGLATRGKKVTVVEVGYCADTRYHAKLEEKQEQHAQLKGILQVAGH